MRVLLVEDDEPQRRLVLRRLTKEGHDVRWAPTAGAAQTLLDTVPFDLVLLDIGLGEGKPSGMEVARYMWTVPRLHEIPIVVVSGLTTEEVHQAATVNVLQGQRLMLAKPWRSENIAVLLAFMRSLEKRTEPGTK